MNCPRCHAELPDVAHFCHVCGQDVRSDDLTRRRSFAAKPDEPVASFALVSTIMPRGAGERPQTYRIALTIALVVALVAAIFGALPIAILVAAFSIPIVYIVYLYDVNLWEDEPIPVTGLAFGLTGVLTIIFTMIVMWLLRPSIPTTSLDGSNLGGGPSVWTFLLVALVVPVVGEAIREVGPILLASRPEFDDLMDGLTFGVISGVAYACFDTIVRYWDLLVGGPVDTDPGLWMSLVFLHGFVKPLLLGTATGIACAEYSGLGRGYDGFTPRYYRGVVEAVLANIGFWGGIYLFSFIADPTLSVVLSTGWALLILGILILRVRNVLHTGLMEAALERSARGGWCGRSRRAPVLRSLRDAAAGQCLLLHRLRHGRAGPGQAAQDPGRCTLGHRGSGFDDVDRPGPGRDRRRAPPLGRPVRNPRHRRTATAVSRVRRPAGLRPRRRPRRPSRTRRTASTTTRRAGHEPESSVAAAGPGRSAGSPRWTRRLSAAGWRVSTGPAAGTQRTAGGTTRPRATTHLRERATPRREATGASRAATRNRATHNRVTHNRVVNPSRAATHRRTPPTRARSRVSRKAATPVRVATNHHRVAPRRPVDHRRGRAPA